MEILHTGTDLYDIGDLPPDHHGGRLERVVTQPQLPDDASVVAIVSIHREVFPIEIRLEAAGM